VLQLELGDGPVEIHPYVTVIRGCSPETRRELLAVLAGIPRGEALAPGLVEAHGVLLDLDAASLALLDLEHDLPVVVGAGELPSRGGVDPFAMAAAERRLADARAQLRSAESILLAAIASRDEAAAALDEQAADGSGTEEEAAAAAEAGGPTAPVPPAAAAEPVEPHGAEPAGSEMARVRAAAAKAEALQERARMALAGAEETAAAAAAAHAAVLGRVRAAEEALEAATARRDPSAAAAVEAARQRLADAEAAVEDARAGGDVAAGVEHTIDEANAERLRLEAELLALETPDPTPVRLALADLSSDRRGTLVPSPEAIALPPPRAPPPPAGRPPAGAWARPTPSSPASRRPCVARCSTRTTSPSWSASTRPSSRLARPARSASAGPRPRSDSTSWSRPSRPCSPVWDSSRGPTSGWVPPRRRWPRRMS
jgi:hypothetical protein